MLPSAIGVPWFTPETFNRVRLISEDNLLDTLEKWEARAERDFERLVAMGFSLEKVLIDPDQLLTFARERRGGKINDIILRDFAALHTRRQYEDRDDSAEISN